MIILALFGFFYLIPMLFLWLSLRRAYQSDSMKREDVEGLFPFTFLPMVNFLVFVWILKEALSEFNLYTRFIRFIIGEKK